MDRVSVIIPAYNIEDYLPRCLDSVIRSRNTNLQILLVDDGSTDGTPAVCDSYAGRDSRITVIHKANGGVSSARNAAIPLIDGQWVSFVDGDDEVSPDLFTVTGSGHHSEVIEKPYETVDADGKRTFTGNRLQGEIKSRRKFLTYWVNYRINTLWNKLITADLIKGHSFDEHFSNGEDMFFFIEFLPEIKKYTFSRQGHYIYYRRPDSATSLRAGKRQLWKDYYFACIDKLSKVTQPVARKTCRAIMYDIYVRNMYLVYDELPADRREIIDSRLRSMSITDLTLIQPRRRRIRLYLWHIKSIFR